MTYTFMIQFGDTDPAGIVYYPNYYRWMDAATHALLEQIGYSTRSLLSEQMTTPLIEAHCVFKSPGYYHRVVHVESHIAWIKRKVFQVVHTFYDGDTKLAEGHEIRAVVSLQQDGMKAILIPEGLQQALATQQVNEFVKNE